MLSQLACLITLLFGKKQLTLSFDDLWPNKRRTQEVKFLCTFTNCDWATSGNDKVSSFSQRKKKQVSLRAFPVYLGQRDGVL